MNEAKDINKTIGISIFKIKNNDKKEFEKMFKLYYNALCMYSLKIVTDRDTAEEIVQDLFCSFWEKRKSINLNSSIKSYLYASTYNNSLMFLRKKKSELKYKSFLKYRNEKSLSPDSYMKEYEVDLIIKNTLDSLPERCKQIFTLSRFEGLKYKEISDKLSVSVKTVEANMSKALKIFRLKLSDYIVIIVLCLNIIYSIIK